MKSHRKKGILSIFNDKEKFEHSIIPVNDGIRILFEKKEINANLMLTEGFTFKT